MTQPIAMEDDSGAVAGPGYSPNIAATTLTDRQAADHCDDVLALAEQQTDIHAMRAFIRAARNVLPAIVVTVRARKA